MTTLRWGFLGTAGIGRKNWQAIRLAENCVLTAVASRDAARSGQYINEGQAAAPFAVRPQAFGSYEALIASPDVEAVYIPLPTALRAQWVIRAARAGKHVLCEKPCATSAKELESMLAACREHHVQFMDGVMFMHNFRMSNLRSVLDDGVNTGQIRRIMSIFSFHGYGEFFQKNIRIHTGLEPAGCLGDLGWYCLRFALWAMKWQAPSEVTGRILLTDGKNSSPLEFSGELFFADGASAGFYCSFLAPNQHWVNVSGTKGWLRLDDFVHPANPQEPSFLLNDVLVPVKDGSAILNQGSSRAQDVNMFRNFANQVRSGGLNEEWPQWSWKTQVVQDACLKSARNGGQRVTVAAF